MAKSVVRSSISIGNLPGKIWHGPCYSSVDDMNASFSFLKENDVSVIWNLLEDDTVVNLEKNSFYVIHTPIEDFSIPTDPDLFYKDAKRIRNLLKAGRSIYVHCMGGHGRTGMAIMFLMIMEGKDPKDSLTLVKALVHGPETKGQIMFATHQGKQVQDQNN